MLKFYERKLEERKQQGLYRSLSEVESAQGRLIRVGGREFLNFSSNNYLGLANHPELVKSFVEGIESYGVGSGASRLINGSLSPLHALEKKVASFKQTEAALVFNSGYHANIGALSCLLGEGDVIFSDELNHASMIDGMRLGKAKKVVYAHGDLEDLRSKLCLRRSEVGDQSRFLIATETVFSMDGDLCPLEGILYLAKEFDCLIYLDEAHATGVLGARGAGLLETMTVMEDYRDRVIQMGTLGKALGCFGAYIAGPKIIIDYLINYARAFIYTTALVPGMASAAIKAISWVEENKKSRLDLWNNIRFFEKLLKKELPDFFSKLHSPIIPIILGDSGKTLKVAGHLMHKGLWVTAIRPPTVAEGSARLRITLMATHTEDDIQCLVGGLKEIYYGSI